MKKLTNFIVILFAPFIIAMAFMCMVAAFIALITPATFQDVTTSGPFWVISIFLLVGSYVYSNEIFE